MNKDKINLLIVDDEQKFLNSISKSLEVRDFNVVAVNRGEKAPVAGLVPAHVGQAHRDRRGFKLCTPGLFSHLPAPGG